MTDENLETNTDGGQGGRTGVEKLVTGARRMELFRNSRKVQ